MCMRGTHVIGGAWAGAGLAVAAGQSWPVVAASAVIAAVVAPGPDIDQHGWWRALDRWVPDEWLGHGGPLQHRGLTHWWGLPVAAVCITYALPLGGLAWVAYALIAGWVSHLVLDFCWGMASPWDHRGPGIPLAPWSHHVGLGLDTGGPTEALFRWGLTAAPAALAWPHVAPLIHSATTAWEATR